ncbi:uncharacterized protein VSU04_010495 isoform 2-T2 [Chlamydotis macqueenii]
MSLFVLFHWIMIQSFIAHTASKDVVRGVIGQSVQLPCSYKVARQEDISDMCWGRGPCPNSKCNNNILHTTGSRVTFRKSQRYSLQGSVSRGDVSLMIRKVKAEDAGTYCCRIEIPGWFNDIKQNVRLEVVAPPVRTTTTRKAPISPKHFRKTTFAPQETSDHQTTAETAVLLTTTVPPATTATTKSPAAITLETITPPAFAVTENDTFPETMVTTSTLPDFPTDFQTADMRTEDDYTFCSAEPVPLPQVTTEFPSALSTAEGTRSADTSLMVEDVPGAGISTSSDDKSEKGDDNRNKFFSSPFQFPSYAILIACVTVVSMSILFILMPSMFWKCNHTKKFTVKSLGPAEDSEKVFSGAEGENSISSL